MASFRIVEEADECFVKRKELIEDVEGTGELQVEINELLPSDILPQAQCSVMARLNQKIQDEGEMEEGELSGDEFNDGNRRRVLEADGISRRMNRSRGQPIQITIQNRETSKLPDLLQEIGGHEVIGIDRDVTEKMEARAKRFNFQPAGSNIHYEDMVELYKSLGISEAEIAGQIVKSERQFRLEAIHIRGFDGSIVRSEDIQEYFSEFSPVSFEWVDKNSANVIWALPSSAAKALLTLSRPLKQDDNSSHNENATYEGKNVQEEDDEMIDIRKAEEETEQEEGDASDVAEESTRMKKQKMKDKILDKFSQPHTAPVFVSEVGIDVPSCADVDQWRIGKPGDKLGVTVFMRIATRHDTALDCGIATSGTESSRLSLEQIRKKNIKLRTTGGIMSNSRKRKLQEVMLAEKTAAEEQEATKKYNGPVGKNPWGTIAEDWSSNCSKGEKDFADELGELANLVGGKKKPLSNRISLTGEEDIEDTESSSTRKREIIRNESSPEKQYPIITRRALQNFTDWDAPENDGVVVTSFRLDKEEESNNARKRKRTGASHDMLNEDTATGTEQDIKWSKRLKRPRMHMVADEIESKLSAKTRLYKGIQRRIDRTDMRIGMTGERIEIFEEEDEENDLHHRADSARRKSEPIIGDKRETLTMSVKINSSKSGKDFSGMRMSERFPAKKGISASLRERLGDVGANKALNSNEEKEYNRRPFETDQHQDNVISKRSRSGKRGYDSGDSLEMDQGDDLRGELDGQQAANMVIQVTQSPKGNDENNTLEEEESGSDDNMDDRRQESHIASVVAKIKKEKNNDERLRIKEEPRDRDHRELINRRQEERRDKVRTEQDRETDKQDHRKREQATREKEIIERERLRKERHRQIDEQKTQELRERTETTLDRGSKRYSRENRRMERSKDDSNERLHKKNVPIRIKKEKLSGDERKKRKGPSGESSSSDDDSSSSSSSDESSSSSSSSESDSSGSSTSSSESTSEDESKSKRHEGPLRKKQKLALKNSTKSKLSTSGKVHNSYVKVSAKRGNEDKKKTTKTSREAIKQKHKIDKKKAERLTKTESKRKDASDTKTGEDNSGLRDKLKDYLNKAKERRKKEKGDTKE